MAGGVFFEEKRSLWAVWFAYHGQKKIYRKGPGGDPFYVEKQATRFLERIRGDLDRLKDRFDPSVYGFDKRVLIENAWEIYNEESPCGPARKRQRDVIFETHIKPYFKGKSIKDIHFLDLDGWVKNLVGADPREQPERCGKTREPSPVPHIIASSYLRNILVTFKHFFKFFHTREILDRVPGFPSVKVPRKEIRWLTADQQAQVHEFIPTQHLPIFKFLQGYGKRSSEVCNIKREDIDWAKKEVKIHNTKLKRTQNMPIGPWFESYLKNPPKVSNQIYVFSTATGKSYTRQLLYQQWHPANVKANQKYGTKIVTVTEGNRKSWASQRWGEHNPVLISAGLDHANIKTTQDYYGKVETQKLGEVVEMGRK